MRAWGGDAYVTWTQDELGFGAKQVWTLVSSDSTSTTSDEGTRAPLSRIVAGVDPGPGRVITSAIMGLDNRDFERETDRAGNLVYTRVFGKLRWFRGRGGKVEGQVPKTRRTGDQKPPSSYLGFAGEIGQGRRRRLSPTIV